MAVGYPEPILETREVETGFEEWQDGVSHAFVPLRSRHICSAHSHHDRNHDCDFRGSLAALPLGSVTVADVGASACVVERTPRLIRSEDPGVLKVGLQLHGRSVLEQHGRQAVLEPGDFALYDTARPYRIISEGDFATRVAMIPREMLHLEDRLLERVSAVRQSATEGMGALLAGLMREAQAGSAGSGVGAARLGDAILDLLAAIYIGQGPEEARHSDAAEASGRSLLLRVVAFIDAHVDSADLNPRTIAAAHFVSVRHLQKVFEAEGETVGRVIRRRRLEHVRRDLADPALAATPVALLGARAGFTDQAHLSRAFKETYGCTPSGYRRQVG